MSCPKDERHKPFFRLKKVCQPSKKCSNLPLANSPICGTYKIEMSSIMTSPQLI